MSSKAAAILVCISSMLQPRSNSLPLDAALCDGLACALGIACKQLYACMRVTVLQLDSMSSVSCVKYLQHVDMWHVRITYSHVPRPDLALKQELPGSPCHAVGAPPSCPHARSFFNKFVIYGPTLQAIRIFQVVLCWAGTCILVILARDCLHLQVHTPLACTACTHKGVHSHLHGDRLRTHKGAHSHLHGNRLPTPLPALQRSIGDCCCLLPWPLKFVPTLNPRTWC